MGQYLHISKFTSLENDYHPMAATCSNIEILQNPMWCGKCVSIPWGKRVASKRSNDQTNVPDKLSNTYSCNNFSTATRLPNVCCSLNRILNSQWPLPAEVLAAGFALLARHCVLKYFFKKASVSASISLTAPLSLIFRANPASCAHTALHPKKSPSNMSPEQYFTQNPTGSWKPYCFQSGFPEWMAGLTLNQSQNPGKNCYSIRQGVVFS